MPKQFIPLFAERSTFQNTVLRVAQDELFEKPIVLTSTDFRFVVADQLRQIGISAEIILEPTRRDSAAAVAVASILGVRRSKDTVMLVLASDHAIDDNEKFREACIEAYPLAASGMIVTFGVVPTYPAVEYGYLRPGQSLQNSEVRQLELFAEKPSLDLAENFVAAGYLWNSGNFLFRSDAMLEEIGKHAPEVRAAAEQAVSQSIRDLDFVRLAAAFNAAPKISIDFAVMEKTRRSAVLPVRFGWSDLGSWDAIWAHAERDSDGNALSGPCEVLNVKDALIQSDSTTLTTVVGLSDIVVVASADAVLVAPRKVSTELKVLIEKLKARNRLEATDHRRIYRPWGYYEALHAGLRHQVKKIQVNPGHRLSLQKHVHRSEHWIVVRGTADVVVNQDSRMLNENESIYIPIGAKHRISNPGVIPLELIEVQVGSYLGEDDITRFEDDYNRV
jgi:mannose-1-phosphate guanylyltransferase/mannose-6-phosphate isomerase